jgi:hypothetical protein
MSADPTTRFREALRKLEADGIDEADDALFDEVVVLGLVSIVESLDSLARTLGAMSPRPVDEGVRG